MAKGQKRMIHTSLWQNEAFAKMSRLAQLLYIGLITIADDDGRLKGNSLLIKSQVFPFRESLTMELFKNHLKEVAKAKFIEIYRVNGEYFIEHPNWRKFQVIRKDLYNPSSLPQNPLRKRTEPVTKANPKLSKDKIREGKETARIDYLKKIPESDMLQFLKRFDVSRKMILSKAEDFLWYCESKGKSYEDYKSALLNAMKKDFTERKEPVRSVRVQELDTPVTPIPQELKNKIDEIVGKKRMPQ